MKEQESSEHLFREFIIGLESTGKKGERLLPFADLSGDFLACPELGGELLKLYQYPCRLKAGVFMLCLRGEIEASVNLSHYRIRRGDFVSILPGSIIQCGSQTEDLQIGFIGFSSAFMGDVNLTKSTMDFLPVMMENPVLPLPERTAEWFHDYFSIMSRSVTLNPNRLHPEVVRCILHSVLYGVGYIYRAHSWDSPINSRGEEIYKQLLQTVRKQYSRERSVAFYARELNISHQHLCTTIRQIAGKTVLDLIADMVIMDAKAQLKSTNLSIQEIAYALNFPDVSSFGKYFKRYVGMGPQKYRES